MLPLFLFVSVLNIERQLCQVKRSGNFKIFNSLQKWLTESRCILKKIPLYFVLARQLGSQLVNFVGSHSIIGTHTTADSSEENKIIYVILISQVTFFSTRTSPNFSHFPLQVMYLWNVVAGQGLYYLIVTIRHHFFLEF